VLVGEPNFGISLFFDDNLGKLAEIRDELFRKKLSLDEEIKSISRKVDMYLPTTYELLPDEDDSIFIQSPFDLNKGLPVKILKQGMSSGKRRVEVFQGKNLGSCAIRFNFYMPRTFKWVLNLDYSRNKDRNKDEIVLEKNIALSFLTPNNISYSPGSIEFSLNDGYSQIIIFLHSNLDYFRTEKNLLLLNPADLEKKPIIQAQPTDSKLYPVISFAYLLKNQSTLEQALDYFIIGSILASSGKLEEAVEYYNKSLRLNEKIGDAIMEVKIVLNLAAVYTAAGSNKEAIEQYNKAYNLLQEQGDTSLTTSVLIALSKNYQEIGEYEQSLEYLNHILDLIREVKSGMETEVFADEMEEANILSEISKALIGLGKFQEAVKYQRDALSSIKLMDDLIGESNGLVRLGETLMSVNQIGEAMNCFEQSLRIRKQIGDERGAADCLKKIGLAFYDRGKLSKAREYYEKAISEFEKIRDYISAEKVRKSMKRLELQPFTNCDLCSLKCSEKIRGMARSDSLDTIFRKEFKKILRDSLSSKDMSLLVNFVSDQASKNIYLTGTGASAKEYAYCLMLHLSDEYLGKIKPQTRLKIERMFKEVLGI
jgi:tetratricopeptide (TPR) repeat protein